jgi:hypothetical protein
MEYYVGQIFEGNYPPMAAIWCNQNNCYIDVIGEKVYQIKEVEPAPEPTRSQMHHLRKQAYAETTDRLTLEKLRLQAIGQWTEEKETAYVAEMTELSDEIKEKYPFSHKSTPVDQVEQGQE